MTTKILTYSFYILFFFTPLFFTPLTAELFEYNKMMLVYVLTTIIVGTWIIKMIQLKQFIFNRTPLDIPILLFLLSQILSTFLSTDIHTSLWGYYSRSNGGLVSIISYILLYYALISNFTFWQAKKFLKAALFGGLAVSLYAIPEHFGLSPSCILLSHTFSADCWVQDVQSRVFATLGQPNWLAAYLEMLIFPAIYFLLTAKTTLKKTFYLLIVTSYYLAFTFSYSRGATIGFIVGLVTFMSLWLVQNQQNLLFLSRFWSRSKSRPPISDSIKTLLLTILIILLINLLFGSALTGDFRLLNKGAPPSRPTLTATKPSGTQLENGGTESGQIRLIVWRGAVEIFKHYPIFGSGVETFAYSYYHFRPIEHNLVSEWDFLYNKAHNEYLNYLATTGIVGFLSYILMIGTFIGWSIFKITNYKLQITNKFQIFKYSNSKLVTSYQLPVTSVLASYIAYLVQNFFGFSVVIIALFFFTFPAFAFLAAAAVKPWQISKQSIIYQIIQGTIFRKKGFQTLSVWVIGVATILVLFTLLKYWQADMLYKKGQDYNDAGNPGRAYNILFDAANLNSNEPLYKAELGNAAASSAVALFEQDATTSAILKQQAFSNTQKALKISPTNTTIWRTAIRTYYDLALIDPTFNPKTIETIDQTIKLAPTDPKLYYNKALILEGLNEVKGEIMTLEKAVELKPNYLEAIFKLGNIYLERGDYVKSKKQFENVLQLTPGDPVALEKLHQIATTSATKK